MLNCLNSIKTRKRQPSQRVRDLAEEREVDKHCSGTKKKRNGLYPIKVLEERDRGEVKIHYLGYGHVHDEWIRKSQIQYLPADSPRVTSKSSQFFTTLACEIKRNLLVDRHEDPKVRIQIPFDSTDFGILKSKGVAVNGQVKGQKIYGILNYCDLDQLLGEQWYLRVCNINGDFSYALLDTIKFHVMKPRAILEFRPDVTVCSPQLAVNTEIQVQFTPLFIQPPLVVVFQFVKKDGNKKQLLKLLNTSNSTT